MLVSPNFAADDLSQKLGYRVSVQEVLKLIESKKLPYEEMLEDIPLISYNELDNYINSQKIEDSNSKS